MNVPHRIGLFEIAEHGVTITEAGIYERHRIRRDVPFAGCGFEREHDLASRVLPAEPGEDVALIDGTLLLPAASRSASATASSASA